MQITSLRLRSLRNHTDITISLKNGINRIHGKNGAGKTTILEAIYLMSTGRSFLTPQLQHLILHNSSSFQIDIIFTKNSIKQRLHCSYDGTHKHIRYNSTSLKTLSSLLGILPSVLYSPKDHLLISGPPQDRRRFLNIQLSQRDPLYVHHLIRYQHALKQRNILLKQKLITDIHIWEKILAHSAQYLMKKRQELIYALSPHMHHYSLKLSNNIDHFNIGYKPSIVLKECSQKDIYARYQSERDKELIMGTSLIGPHRDDFTITYQDNEAKISTSEGQKRTCISALKLAEWELLKELLNIPPLLAIDDFGVHLDQERMNTLEHLIMNCGQVILTSPLPYTQDYLYLDQGKITQHAQPMYSYQ